MNASRLQSSSSVIAIFIAHICISSPSSFNDVAQVSATGAEVFSARIAYVSCRAAYRSVKPCQSAGSHGMQHRSPLRSYAHQLCVQNWAAEGKYPLFDHEYDAIVVYVFSVFI